MRSSSSPQFPEARAFNLKWNSLWSGHRTDESGTDIHWFTSTADVDPTSESSRRLLRSRHSPAPPPPPPCRRRRRRATSRWHFSPRWTGRSLTRLPPHLVSSLAHRVVSPDEAYFATQVIACRDGSGSFSRSRLNDGYCDCADGTDEPGFCLISPGFLRTWSGIESWTVEIWAIYPIAVRSGSGGNNLTTHWGLEFMSSLADWLVLLVFSKLAKGELWDLCYRARSTIFSSRLTHMNREQSSRTQTTGQLTCTHHMKTGICQIWMCRMLQPSYLWNLCCLARWEVYCWNVDIYYMVLISICKVFSIIILFFTLLVLCRNFGLSRRQVLLQKYWRYPSIVVLIVCEW